MFGFSRKVKYREITVPSSRGEEVVFCVFDQSRHLLHHFSSLDDSVHEARFFRFLNNPEASFEHSILNDAAETGRSASLALTYGDGYRKCLHILPYRKKKGEMNFACLQIGRGSGRAEEEGSAEMCSLGPDRFFLLLVDSGNTVQSTSSIIPKAFGYTPENLSGMNLSDLLSGRDLEVMDSCTADTNEAILSCLFFCRDGSRRDIEVRKYSAPDNAMLYAISDVTPMQLTEEITLIATRERRRIGQDLHDSIGQMLTGISLLSRSLANSLKRIGNSGDLDASQISALADEASNQIRQISRGLMPSDIVQKGLFDSLRELARKTTSTCGIPCEARLDDSVEFSDGAVETHLYRIAQEAVNNSVRHSGATRIELVISKKNGLSRLEVVDNGIWKEMPGNTSGIGMKTMEYRASAIGAQLKVGALPQGGSRVICVIEEEDLVTIEA